MRITATATVEIEVEVMDALIERDMDINDPDTLTWLIDGRGTNAAIVEAFYSANNLKFMVEEVPDRVRRCKQDWAEYYREVIEPQIMGA